jgi:hypothetical protein
MSRWMGQLDAAPIRGGGIIRSNHRVHPETVLSDHFPGRPPRSLVTLLLTELPKLFLSIGVVI